jgi:acyl carrier protein
MKPSGQGSTELLIASIWTRILGVEEIAATDSFFEIGGDSMMMVDMLVELGSALKTEIDPTLLFTDATLRGFSSLVASSVSQTASDHS